MTEKKVAKAKNTAVSVDTISDLEAFAGQGTENIGTRDVKLPIIKLLTKISPALDEDNAKYVAGAKPGDMLNEVTGSIYKGKEGMLVVPCHYINTFNEWADRGSQDSTGAPVAIHRDPTVMKDTNRADDGKDRLSNGHYIEDTANHFVYILNEDYKPIETALITMKSTQKKKSRLWNTMMMSKKMEGSKGFFTPPTWATVYRLTSIQEENSKGKWYGWAINFERFLDQPTDSDTLKVTQGFSESSKKMDIANKVDYSEDGIKDAVVVETKKSEAVSKDSDFENGTVPF
jgi:hypothetical protein|tara:strand:+ start:657 stop:1520 length:864 start_codon:yes stop_codon:yes gene_type:complete